MIYVVQLKEHTVLDDKIQKNILRSDGSSIVVCLCENGTIKEELIFDFDEPIDIDYEYPENGLIIVKKYTPGFQDQPKAATFYRLEGKELVEAIN